ncbi:MAG: Na(+)-translocating NADH-quinone reductase subunit C [Acidobacteria bacterium]|jgi:Na+-transporting NADH:ubiquinone oxidoreductase subunit C|nr:Na(+)-translocating NADH-quinone reductase subunit C [Acidobacteriota bacterium]MDP7338678.1 Na(+)-translocating NADH-quinone reductase subunit C [Vicinamibacterales bacterium]MDP7478076.1 Na(+)-translocating NADH-quinone reductase subunit C [Vicinamibacterales bacterium]MDP7691972.1 Na(+)-translocating NADH-quinone reductase subunit C [Vicinamibacterales bacterium]HJN43425.1 Na(+)-translocating NADH-quinone reductase subunit C [Vicinamibacterales bacterium]|tara:strand:+ start:6369 stop:7151 length:783 start_codon:yes stop_codon:yes gene_type:complete
MQGSIGYNLAFAAAVCLVCAVVVSSSAVALADRQDRNAALDRQKNVLLAAGLATDDESLDADEVVTRFGPITRIMVNLATGERVGDVDPATFDQRAATIDPVLSRTAPDNAARIARLPNTVLVYEIRDEADRLEAVILPVEGLGLWGTLYGFIALEGDLRTIRGLTFYEHKETPGLGGEVDNPRWKARWTGRLAFDDDLAPAIAVVKGLAGAVADDPHAVDGLSGATLTSRGVTNLLRFWLGPDGFDPYLTRLRAEGSAD